MLKLEAAQAILDYKLADAELGIEGANERLDDAEVLIDEAFTLADQAKSTADAALVSANGKQNIYRDTGDPSGTAPENSVWFKVNGAGSVIAQFQYVDGAWVEAPVSSEVIANLDVGKLTAGSAVIDELVAQKIAAASGQFLELDVGQLVASEAVIGEAVAQKIWADSTVTRLLTAEDIIAGSAIINGTITADKVLMNEAFADKFWANEGNFGKVTAQMLTITPGNLVDDPGFERPLGERWFTNASAGVAIEPNASLPGPGLHFTTTGYPVRSAPFPVVAGEEYAVSYRATRYTRISFEWLDADGATLGYSGPGASDHEGFRDFTHTAPAPATALQARAYVQFTGGGATEGWAGKPQFRPAVGASLIVDGAIDGKTITGSTIRTAASGTRMSLGPGVGGSHGMWLYDSAGIARGSLTGGTSGNAAMLQLNAANGDARTRLTDVGAQFYNNARIDLYGTVDRYGILERKAGAVGLRIWGGNGGTDEWAYLSLENASDGLLINTHGVYSRTTTLPANMFVGGTGNFGRSTSVKAAKIDVEDASSSNLLNVAYRSWVDKQAMIDAVLGRTDTPTRRTVGAVAEEMEVVAPELCTYDEHGTLTGIAYDRVALALIPLLRDLTNRIEHLEGAPVTEWPESPSYDDTALWDEVTAYGSEEPEQPMPSEPTEEL